MSGQTDIIYKKPIAIKTGDIYRLLRMLPDGTHISRDEIYELCKAYSHKDVKNALEQLTEAELIIKSEDGGSYSLNPNKRIKEKR